jgi:hypothetical protein
MTRQCQRQPDHFTPTILHALIDTDRIDDAALALLWLGLHDGCRTWKGFDWDVMDRLHRKGMISDPVGTARSVVFTEEGQREAERLFRMLFSRRS